MSYHDHRFARRSGETPLRPQYASWWEAPEPAVTTNHVWFTTCAITFLLAVSATVGYFYNV